MSNICASEFERLVQIDADSGIEKVVGSRIVVANRIADVARHFRMRFEINSRRKISGCIFAGIPINRHAEFVGYRLLKTELSACPRRRRDDVFRKIITAAGDASFAFESFAQLRVGVIADVVTFIANRNKHIVADDYLHAVILAVINAPFNRRNKRRRIISGIDIASYI